MAGAILVLCFLHLCATPCYFQHTNAHAHTHTHTHTRKSKLGKRHAPASTDLNPRILEKDEKGERTVILII